MEKRVVLQVPKTHKTFDSCYFIGLILGNSKEDVRGLLYLFRPSKDFWHVLCY